MPLYFSLRSFGRRRISALGRSVPIAWRPRMTRVARLVGITVDVWDRAKVAAERDPMVDRYRATRPTGPLRHRIGVTIAPGHVDEPALRAAARELGGDVTFFDPDDPAWSERVLGSGCDGHIVRLRHRTSVERALDGDRLALLHLAGVPAWPTPAEAYLYEDKARLGWFLAARGVPCVPTRVFTREADARSYLTEAVYPIVVKTRLGASGSGVERIDAPRAALAFARHVFRGRLQRPLADPRDGDFGYLIVQPFIADAAEHRVIKLGDAFFAHGKTLGDNGWRYSGSGRRNWESPGWHVLDGARAVADRLGLTCGAIDLLETPDGVCRVLEVQVWYAGFRVSQMDVDGVPGMAHWRDGAWEFVEGAFHVNRGQNLRLLAFDRFLSEGRTAPSEPERSVASRAGAVAPAQAGAGRIIYADVVTPPTREGPT